MDAKIRESLFDVLKRIPLKTRKELSTQITDLCEITGLENNFMFNRCGLYTGARTESARTNISKAGTLKRLNMPRYWVWIEGHSLPKEATLSEAAEFMGVSETSIKVRVSSGRHYERERNHSEFTNMGKKKGLQDGIHVCSKMGPEDLERFEKEYKEKLHRGEFDIQSVSSARQ